MGFLFFFSPLSGVHSSWCRHHVVGTVTVEGAGSGSEADLFLPGVSSTRASETEGERTGGSGGS